MILSKVSLVVALALGAAVVVLPAQAQISSAPVSPDPISSDQMAPEQITPAFRVGDIRVEGLQRVSEGTVYNYLPVNIGDRLTAQRIREAIRALYETGFFVTSKCGVMARLCWSWCVSGPPSRASS
ncbi:MAG: hypothetical protein IPG25_14070 [Proteobacteria bacterium]|nr:hypothetical protein [Pseudomonadota bacterium]